MPEVELPLIIPGAKIKFTKDEVEKFWRNFGQKFQSWQKAKSSNEAATSMSEKMKRARFVFIQDRVSEWTDEGSENNHEWKRVIIWLSSFYENYRDNIEKVVWYLPDGFEFPVRVRTIHDKNYEKFAIYTAAYGDFTVSAEVFFNNGKKSILVNRVINIETNIEYSDAELE
jgi:hypothetical protein